MSPRRSLRELIRGALPVGCLVGVLSMLFSELEHYRPYFSISTMASLYIWTVVWMSTFLVSLRYTTKTGPLMVACHGWMRNCLILWDVYGSLGNDLGCEDVGMAEFAGLVVCTAAAGGVSYYLGTRFCSGFGKESDDDAAAVRETDDYGSDDVEKIRS